MQFNKRAVNIFIRNHKLFMAIALVFIAAAFDFTLSKYQFNKKATVHHHIDLPEEICAAKAGDTLYIHEDNDTVTSITFDGCIGCKAVTVLGN